jgi:beta-lactamase superfamily II metal-dependent hydrolase
MSVLNIWFLNVGHGDCSYIELPNGARLMIDCGSGGNNWPSKLLKHYKITKSEKSVSIPEITDSYGIDNLIISHPHTDHFSDLKAIHDDIGFYLLSGGYRGFIDQIQVADMDWHKRGQEQAKYFIEIVNKYKGEYKVSRDRIDSAKDMGCRVSKKRFIEYQQGVDLNDISYLTTLTFGTNKILFAGDLTASGVETILKSSKASEFKEFVSGTTILKVPHHGRENGCSKEMFDLFGIKPLLCVVSDSVLNEKNQGTANTEWYTRNTSDQQTIINGQPSVRKVLTTRCDGDINMQFKLDGSLTVTTNYFAKLRKELLS